MALMYPAGFSFLDSNGNPVASGSVAFYSTGTQTLKAIYTDKDLTIAATNPFDLDASGRFSQNLYGSGDYTVKCFSEAAGAGTTVFSRDDVFGWGDGTPYYERSAEEIAAGVTPSSDGYQYRPGNARRYGATGDGVTDDSTAVHACLTYAGYVGGTAYFPAGTYRVTSTFTTTADYKNILIRGDGAQRVFQAGQGSIIQLDSSSAAVGFFFLAHRMHLQVSDITFRCAQAATDRPFFKLYGALYHFSFENVDFESVERPIVLSSGGYFQNGSLRNVQFRASGTIHSEFTGTNLAGTLLRLDNVNHETTVPSLTEKVVCNLYGIRNIVADNLLLEGTLPSSGWTILKLGCRYAADWTRSSVAEINGYWSEWVSTQPTYVVDQTGGTCVFRSGVFGITSTATYNMTNSATAILENASLTGSADAIGTLFTRENSYCNVVLQNCKIRSAIGIEKNDFALLNCQLTPDSNADTNGFGATVFSNIQSVEAYKWGGGIPDGESFIIGGSDTYVNSTDSTYGRKLVVTPFSASSLFTLLSAAYRGVVGVDSQVWVVIEYKLPTFSNGSVYLYTYQETTTGAALRQHTSADSGGTFRLVCPIRVTTTITSKVGIRISASGSTTLGSTLDIYQFALYVGNSAPKIVHGSYPKNIITYSSAAPTTGTWLRGDVVWNTAPAAAGAPGWVCVTGGTPGTWKAMANVAA